jgi:hypothetical protein
MMLFKNFHKVLIFLSFFISTIKAEDIYKVEVIIIKFNDVITEEKFSKNINFSPIIVKNLKEREPIVEQEEFIDNNLISIDTLDKSVTTTEKDINHINEIEKNIFELYEYTNLEDLDFLIGRLKWRENIKILDSLSWYQPLKDQEEYTLHFDQENNVSLYVNIYVSRYLHINLKAFFGQLNSENEITEFINEDRRVKNSEISYFDHPSMGVIIRIDRT